MSGREEIISTSHACNAFIYWDRKNMHILYLREWDLRHAAKDCKKLTSFFPVKQSCLPEPDRLTPSEPEPIAMPPIESASLPTEAYHASNGPQCKLANDGVNNNDNNSIPSNNITPAATIEVPDVTTFLDTAEDDDDAPKPVLVLETVKMLISSVIRFKSLTSLFYLNAVKEFIKLWDKYKTHP
jgi:hypothetical protein